MACGASTQRGAISSICGPTPSSGRGLLELQSQLTLLRRGKTPPVVAANRRQNKCGRVGRGVLLFYYSQILHRNTIKCKLRTARAIVAAKQIVRARVWN